jgi:hypothetical protein
MPSPMASLALPPLRFHGVKLPLSMKNKPTMAMKASAAYFRYAVTSWKEPMFLSPLRLTKAGTQSPTSTSRIDPSFAPPLLMNTST